MPRLKWSATALLGVQKAYRFLAEHDVDAAKAAARTIRKQTAILEKHPQAGRPADDLDPEHRELLISFGASGYVLVYEVFPEYILILAVRHQREAGFGDSLCCTLAPHE